jgi:phospho-N-acetylmuramoyl-pentapeptide-transferase
LPSSRQAAFGIVGFTDDYLKIVRRSHHGLLPRYKMGGQIIVALAVGVAVLLLAQQNPPLYNTRLIFPFFKNLIPDLGWFLRRVHVLVLVGASNAVNLTDGLDGSPSAPFAVSAAAFTGARLCHRDMRYLRNTFCSSGLLRR